MVALPAGHLARRQRHVILGVELAGVNDGLNAPFALDLQSGRPAMARCKALVVLREWFRGTR
jgi:hypothetical protein